MTEANYERYIIREPLYECDDGIKNHQGPAMTYMSNNQIPGINHYLEYNWIYGIPEPNPYIYEHASNFPMIVLYIGGDPDNPEELGGEVEFNMGGQPLTFNTTSALFIPAGVSHGPIKWKKFDKPHIQMMISFGNGDVLKWCGNNVTDEPSKKVSPKPDNIDY